MSVPLSVLLSIALSITLFPVEMAAGAVQDREAGAGGDVGQDAPQPPQPEPEHVIIGSEWRAEFDLARGRLLWRDIHDHRILADLPLGLVIRPGTPERRLQPVGGDAFFSLAPPQMGGAAGAIARPTLSAAHIPLVDGNAPPIDEDRKNASVIVRPAGAGLAMVFSIPRVMLVGGVAELGAVGEGELFLDATSFGDPLQVQGERVLGGSVTGRGVFRIADQMDAESGARLRGSVALDDRSPEGAWGRVIFRSGGEVRFDSGEMQRGGAPREFDFALARGGETRLFVESDPFGDRAIVDLLGVELTGPGDQRAAILERARGSRPGIDLMVDAEGRGAVGFSATLPMPGGPSAFALSRRSADGSSPPPWVVCNELDAGGVLGIGLIEVSDITRMGMESNRLAFDLPLGALSYDSEFDDELRLVMLFLPAKDRVELAARYRAALIELRAAPAIRPLGALRLPDWWRRPLLRAEPPPGRGRFGRYDAWSVQQLADKAEAALGKEGFSIVIDGPWYARLGSPAPSDTFSELRGLIAREHVHGRRVLLQWPLFDCDAGSFADISGAVSGDRADPTIARRFENYIQEMVRRTLSTDLDALGADGLLITGLDRVPDGTTSPVARPTKGVGLRVVQTALKVLMGAALNTREDALILTRAIAPQWAELHSGVYVSGARLSARHRSDRVAELLALLPDVPLFYDPGPVVGGLDGVDGDSPPSMPDLLRAYADAVAFGVPSVGSRMLLAMSDGDRAALWAILTVAGQRRIGIPSRLDGDRFHSVVEERVLVQSLAAGGVVAFKGRDEVVLAVVHEGDVELPFVPSAVLEPADAVIGLEGGVALLRSARPGVVYRLRR